MAALIQDEQLTEHSIRVNYDDEGDDDDYGDCKTSLFPASRQKTKPWATNYLFSLTRKKSGTMREIIVFRIRLHVKARKYYRLQEK